MAKLMSSANRAFDAKVETYERVTCQKYMKTHPTPSPAIHPSPFVIFSHQMDFFHLKTNATYTSNRFFELCSLVECEQKLAIFCSTKMI